MFLKLKKLLALSALRDTVLMDGELTNGIYHQISLKWKKKNSDNRAETYQTKNKNQAAKLTRKTICFSRTEKMHDLVVDLSVDRYEFEVKF